MPRAFGAATMEEEKQKLVELAAFLSEGTPRRDLQQEYWVQFRSASPESQDDKDVVMAAVAMDGMLLRWASDGLRDDLEVVTTALKKSPWVLQHASETVRGSRQAVLQAVGGHGRAVKFASDELRADRNVIMAAVRMDGHALQHASEELRANKDFVLEAVQCHSCTLEYASEELQADREVVMKALQRQAQESFLQTNVLVHVSPALQRDPDIVLEGVKYSGTGLGYAAMDLKRDKDFVLLAARHAPEGQAWNCYFEGSPEVKAVPWEFFGSVVDSRLACPGESAPVLSISLSLAQGSRLAQGPDANANLPCDQLNQPSNHSCGGSLVCEATLLSGANFQCFLGDGNADSDGDVGSAVDGGCSLTLNDLAARMVLEVSQRLEVGDPSRVFIIIGQGQDENVAVTPWDRDRPLTEFVRPA